MKKTVEKSKTNDFMLRFASEVNKNSRINAFLINQVVTDTVLFLFFYIKRIC